jgi:flagellar protein FlaF
MYQFLYAETSETTPKQARHQEYLALLHSIELLSTAEEHGVTSQQTVEALLFLRRLWTVFIEDLSKPENELPQKLRADLISIGLWILKESEEIRFGRSKNFRGIMEITQVVADGLKS